MQEYIRADQNLHLLSQLIAKANRTFIPKKEDDSHTNLYFDALGNRITGRWIDAGNSKILFALSLENQSIAVFDETGKRQVSIATISRHIEEVQQEIEKVLPNIDLEPSRYSEPLHFQIPDYDFAENPIEKISPNGLSQWKYYRNMANQACFEILGFTQKWEEVRLWPHHFDTGVYLEINDTTGIGFGLAMQDDMVGEPYFYYSAYGLNGHTIDYSSTPPLTEGKWFDENWKGAVLPLHRVNQQSIRLFLHGTMAWLKHN